MLLDVAAAQMSERTLELLAHDWAGSGLGPKDRSMRKSGRRRKGKDAPRPVIAGEEHDLPESAHLRPS